MNSLRKAILTTIGVILIAGNATASDKAPDFSLPTDQGTVSLASLKGKPVYIDFWASWCGPCRKSFPWMADMQAKFKEQGLQVVAINLDSNREAAAEFLKEMPAKFTVAYDPDGKTADAFGVKGMPTSYLVDREGNIKSVHLGFLAKDKPVLEAAMRELVSEK